MAIAAAITVPLTTPSRRRLNSLSSVSANSIRFYSPITFQSNNLNFAGGRGLQCPSFRITTASSMKIKAPENSSSILSLIVRKEDLFTLSSTMAWATISYCKGNLHLGKKEHNAKLFHDICKHDKQVCNTMKQKATTTTIITELQGESKTISDAFLCPTLKTMPFPSCQVVEGLESV